MSFVARFPLRVLPNPIPLPLPGGFSMPVHHVPRRELRDHLQEFTRQRAEHVVSVVPDPEDSDCYLVVTEWHEIETRDEP